MKRIFSMILAMALLFSCAAMLSSCGSPVSTEQAEKNASAVLTAAIERTSIFSDEAGLGEALESVMESGAIGIEWAASALGESYPDIDATLYFDRGDKKAVLDASLAGGLFGDEPTGMKVYLSSESIMLSSPLLLGSDRTLAIYRDGLEEKLEDSVLAELGGGMSDEDIAEMVSSLEELWNSLEESFKAASEEKSEEAEEFLNGALDCLDPRVSEGKVKNADGKDVDAVTLSYTVNAATLARVADYVAGVERQADAKADEDGEDADGESAGVDLTLSVSISKGDGTLVGISFAGEVRREENPYEDLLGGFPMPTSADDVELDEDYLLDDEIFVGDEDTDDGWADEWDDENYDDWFDGEDDWLDGEDDWLDGDYEDWFEDFGTEIVMAEINGALLFSENTVSMTATSKVGEETSEIKGTLSKRVDGDKVTYTLEGLTNGVKTAGATLLYNKKSGDVILSAKSYDGDKETVVLEIKGSLKKDAKGTVITVDSYKAGAVTVELGLTLSFRKDAEMPAFPKDAEDVLTMDEEDYAELLDEMQNGILGLLLMGGF